MVAQLQIYVPPHPLLRHWLAIARAQDTPPVLFRTALGELGRWLTYEAVREWLPELETTVETPLASTPAHLVDPAAPLAVVPVLRAGLPLLEGAQALIPLAPVYHLGLVRDETTLQPRLYLNHLPERLRGRVLVFEPMVATGGTALAVMEQLVARGVDPAMVRFISVVCAHPGLQRLNVAYPGLTIFAATIDPEVNGSGFIVPGLGDAGDRAFDTGPPGLDGKIGGAWGQG